MQLTTSSEYLGIGFIIKLFREYLKIIILRTATDYATRDYATKQVDQIHMTPSIMRIFNKLRFPSSNMSAIFTQGIFQTSFKKIWYSSSYHANKPGHMDVQTDGQADRRRWRKCPIGLRAVWDVITCTCLWYLLPKHVLIYACRKSHDVGRIYIAKQRRTPLML